MYSRPWAGFAAWIFVSVAVFSSAAQSQQTQPPPAASATAPAVPLPTLTVESKQATPKKSAAKKSASKAPASKTVDPAPAPKTVSSNPNSAIYPPAPYAGGQVATGGQLGMLGNRSVLDAPFNQTSYTAQTLQDQQARSITDVLYNDPSAGAGLPRNASREQPFIRGLPLTDGDIAINGLAGLTGNNTFSIIEGPNASRSSKASAHL